MKISCIVIDDEPLAISKLENFIARIPELALLKTFGNALDAIVWLRENHADLIFLDIQMEQFSGLQFLESAGTDARVIITSAYDQYAINGYDFNVTDYLLKPFSFQRFVKAVGRVMDSFHSKTLSTASVKEKQDFVFVKTEYRLERIDIDDILYIEGMKDYLRIVCTGKKIMVLQSFSKLADCLPADRFCRVHKSYIVAIDKINSIERGVITISGRRIPVSATYRDNFFNKLESRLP